MERAELCEERVVAVRFPAQPVRRLTARDGTLHRLARAVKHRLTCVVEKLSTSGFPGSPSATCVQIVRCASTARLRYSTFSFVVSARNSASERTRNGFPVPGRGGEGRIPSLFIALARGSPSAWYSPLQKTALREAEGRRPGHDEMVEDLYVDHGEGFPEAAGQHFVCLARLCNTRGMVVRKDHGCCIRP